ncbi:amidohydrolase family protein [Staphylothermus hellenicus]|uniref:S-adenosylhomocysteine deaminase n=1 Tax=Staphylothermus hellenicus (strain DSM 12710 / JCM 10830 / BK20S6-10-b1 / P8) TaxID=591019 RepID=D7DC31_STAHD|nr:amidohydrolase family protein [Staphylothermus hellenicus]ADI31728.1 S-adenosylhomocysteine deaminase [Staphylothermus hellenicus DSM 12710]
MEDLFIRNARFILTPNSLDNTIVYENKDIVIENGIITCIGDHCSKPRGSLVIDASKHVITPAYINAHTRAGTAFLRGSMPDQEYWDLIRNKKILEEKLVSPELVFHSSRLSCAEMLLNGIMGFVDAYYYPEETIEACIDLGLHVSTGPSMPVEKELRSFLSKYKNIDKVHPIINIPNMNHSRLEELEQSFSLARKYGLKIHLQVSETRREVFLFKKHIGHWPIEYLYKKKLLGEDVYLVNANWVSSTELEYISEEKAALIICPHRSMRLAIGGFAPVYEAMRKHILLTVGTDDFTGDRMNVLSEIRELLLLYRHYYKDTRLRLGHTYSYTVVNGYRVMGIKGGSIKESYPANLVVYDIDALKNTPLHPQNLLSRLILGNGFTPHYVVVDSHVIYDSSKHDELVKKIQESIAFLERISQRINYETGEPVEQA